MGLFQKLAGLAGGTSGTVQGRQRISLIEPAWIYAVGDVHGRLDLLKSMEDTIASRDDQPELSKIVVYLGDIVDRGPNSAQVIDHLMRDHKDGLKRIVICGNHEALMLEFLRKPKLGSLWLRAGGVETLRSYGVPEERLSDVSTSARLSALVEAYVPTEHIQFLESLPVSVTTPRHILVHAGLRSDTVLEDHSDEELMWGGNGGTVSKSSREEVVVHGHTIVDQPMRLNGDVSIDTGAYRTGRLSCLLLSPTGSGDSLISVTVGGV